jgi:hypothetical protein
VRVVDCGCLYGAEHHAAAGGSEDGAIVPMSETPTDAFSSWYGGLDSVIEYAVANDPKVETKVREPFILDGKLIDNGCEDKNEKCKWWAEIGECQKNPGCVILSLLWFALGRLRLALSGCDPAGLPRNLCCECNHRLMKCTFVSFNIIFIQVISPLVHFHVPSRVVAWPLPTAALMVNAYHHES